MIRSVGVYLNGIDWTWTELRDTFLAAERLDFDAAWMMDNVVGPEPIPDEVPVFDTWTALPALAAVTESIRLGTLVTPIIRRHPAVVAKSSTTLDLISDGRLDLALGPGDAEVGQFIPWGIEVPPMKQRIAMLEDGCRIIKKMWTEPYATYSGTHYSIEGAVNEPKPVQEPHPPLWLGVGGGRKLMPRAVARHADGFNVYQAKDSEASEAFKAIENACEIEGRDFASMQKARILGYCITSDDTDRERFILDQGSAMKITDLAARQWWFEEIEQLVIGSPETVVGAIRESLKMGFDTLILCPYGISSGGRALGNEAKGTIEQLELFSREVMPELRGVDVKGDADA